MKKKNSQVFLCLEELKYLGPFHALFKGIKTQVFASNILKLTYLKKSIKGRFQLINELQNLLCCVVENFF